MGQENGNGDGGRIRRDRRAAHPRTLAHPLPTTLSAAKELDKQGVQRIIHLATRETSLAHVQN